MKALQNKSIKINYIYNMILTVSNILIPMITFPYVSRILGPIGLGKVNYAMSIAAYFIMIAQAGIPVYGIKEIAKVRDDKEKTSKVFAELFLINTIMMILSMISYSVLFILNNKIQDEKGLFIVIGIYIFTFLFSIDWLYSGLEEYRYITLRSLIVRIGSIVFLFLFVKDRNDYINYAIITTTTVAIANFINIIHAKKYVRFSVHKLNMKKHIKPMAMLFFAGIIGSVYGNLDVILLGNMGGDKYVGFYSTNRKICSLVITMITSLGTVLVPRLSYYISKDMKDEYNKLAEQSLNFIYFLSFPAIVYILFMSKELLLLFGGKEFLPASVSLKIISFQIIATSLTTFFGLQVILAHNDEKVAMKSNFFGAIVNLILNTILIKNFVHNGAAISIFLSETTVLIAQVILTKKYVSFKFFSDESIKYIEGSVILFFTLYIFKIFAIKNYLISLILSGIIAAVSYFGFLLVKKECFCTMVLEKLIKKER